VNVGTGAEVTLDCIFAQEVLLTASRHDEMKIASVLAYTS
jgi:hypothetical protein